MWLMFSNTDRDGVWVEVEGNVALEESRLRLVDTGETIAVLEDDPISIDYGRWVLGQGFFGIPASGIVIREVKRLEAFTDVVISDKCPHV